MKIEKFGYLISNFSVAAVIAVLNVVGFPVSAGILDLTSFAKGDFKETFCFDLDTKKFLVDGHEARDHGVTQELLERVSFEVIKDFVENNGYFEVKNGCVQWRIQFKERSIQKPVTYFDELTNSIEQFGLSKDASKEKAANKGDDFFGKLRGALKDRGISGTYVSPSIKQLGDDSKQQVSNRSKLGCTTTELAEKLIRELVDDPNFSYGCLSNPKSPLQVSPEVQGLLNLLRQLNEMK